MRPIVKPPRLDFLPNLGGSFQTIDSLKDTILLTPKLDTRTLDF